MKRLRGNDGRFISSKKEMELVGKPFYRSKRIERPGTGLGLCTTIKLAKLLGWHMHIESEINAGTSVRFTLYHITG